MNEFDHLTPRAEQHSYDHSKRGTVFFGACPCCGTVRWVSSAREPADELKIVVQDDFDPNRCEPCGYVAARHPELFQWVNAVVTRQIGRAIKGLTEAANDAKEKL